MERIEFQLCRSCCPKVMFEDENHIKLPKPAKSGFSFGKKGHLNSVCPYFVRTSNKKALSVATKCLIYNDILVGDASFELATPAV